MLHATPDGGVAISILGPVTATLPNSIVISVTGDYPFEDNITISLSGLPQQPITFPLYIRIPSWADAATLYTAGGGALPVGSANGTLYKVNWAGASGPTATLTLATNPAIRLAPWYNGAMAVSRGALLYSLRLDETFQVTGHAAGAPLAADYIVSQPGCDLSPSAPGCTAAWNVALVVDDAANPAGGFTFSRTGPTPPVPFAAGLWGASNLELTALVRQVNTWGLDRNSAAPPPSSPVDCTAQGACGAPYLATFVPYGATHLRMAELPWTTRPPCGAFLGYNASGATRLPGGGAGFDLWGGAGLVANGPLQNLRSGGPGDVSTAAYLVGVRDATHAVTGLSFEFSYVAGYGGDGAPGGATVEVVALKPGACGAGGAVLASLWTSPVLSHFPYDVCNTCYSPPIPVHLPAGSLNLSAVEGLVLALRFTNNARNVQLKLPMDATVFWG